MTPEYALAIIEALNELVLAIYILIAVLGIGVWVYGASKVK